MANKSDYKKSRFNIFNNLPSVNQSDTLEAFLEGTVNRFLTKPELSSIKGKIGSGVDTIPQPTVFRDAFQLQPIIEVLNGSNKDHFSYEDVKNILSRLGVDINRLNEWGQSIQYNFVPPVNIDKIINYSDYFWDDTNPNSTPQYITIENEQTRSNAKVIQFLFDLARLGVFTDSSDNTTVLTPTYTSVPLPVITIPAVSGYVHHIVNYDVTEKWFQIVGNQTLLFKPGYQFNIEFYAPINGIYNTISSEYDTVFNRTKVYVVESFSLPIIPIAIPACLSHNINISTLLIENNVVYNNSLTIEKDKKQWIDQNKWKHKKDNVNFASAKRATLPIIEFNSGLELNEWIYLKRQWKYRQDLNSTFENVDEQPTILELLKIEIDSYDGTLNKVIVNGNFTSIFTPNFEFSISGNSNNNGRFSVASSSFIASQTHIFVKEDVVNTVAPLGFIEPSVRTQFGHSWLGFTNHWLLVPNKEQKFSVNHQPVNNDLISYSEVAGVNQKRFPSGITSTFPSQFLYKSVLNSETIRVYVDGIRQYGSYREISLNPLTVQSTPLIEANFVDAIEFFNSVNNGSVVTIEFNNASTLDFDFIIDTPSSVICSGVLVRTIEDDIDFSINGPEFFNLTKYKKFEQVKTQINQYPLFDLYDVNSNSAFLSDKIFSFRESSSSPINSVLNKRIVTENGNDFIFDNSLVSLDNQTLFYYRDYKKIEKSYWYDDRHNIVLKFNFNDKVWEKQERLFITHNQPTAPLIGDVWFKPSTNELFVFSGIWVLTPFYIQDTDPSLSSIWKPGSDYESYIPKYVDSEKSEITIGDPQGDWELPNQLYFNVSHENRKYINFSELLTHFQTIVQSQIKVPSFSGTDNEYYRLLEEPNLFLGGLIKEFNTHYDTFLSSVIKKDVTVLKLLDFAADQNEYLLSTNKSYFRDNVINFLNTVDPNSISDLSSFVISSIQSNQELNDYHQFLFGDSDTHDDSIDHGLKNWISTFPFYRWKNKYIPIFLHDDKLKINKLKHHDSHLSDVILSKIEIDDFSYKIVNSVDQRSYLNNIQQLPPFYRGRVKSFGPPASLYDYNRYFSDREVLVSTVSNIILSGLQTIDGVVLAVNDRVLVKDQINSSDNGIYTVQTGTWLRSSDMSSSSHIKSGFNVFVLSGIMNTGTVWKLGEISSFTLGVDSILFQQYFDLLRTSMFWFDTSSNKVYQLALSYVTETEPLLTNIQNGSLWYDTVNNIVKIFNAEGLNENLINISNIITNQFEVVGDFTSYFRIGSSFKVVDSTANDRIYTVESVLFSAGTTKISVNKIPSNIVDGQIAYLNSSLGNWFSFDSTNSLEKSWRHIDFNELYSTSILNLEDNLYKSAPVTNFQHIFKYDEVVTAKTTLFFSNYFKVDGVLTALSNGSFPLLDGVTVNVGDRVLLNNAYNSDDNGVYVLINSGSISTQWVLRLSEKILTNGSIVKVVNGIVDGGTYWVLDDSQQTNLFIKFQDFNKKYDKFNKSQIFDFSKYIKNINDGNLFNSYLEEFFLDNMKNKNIIDPYSSKGYFVISDAFTWNYAYVNPSLTLLPSNFNTINDWAANWQSLYEKLYGTAYPHLEPWVLQGYNNKPDWWDQEYKSNTRRWLKSMWETNLRLGIVPAGRYYPSGKLSTGNTVLDGENLPIYNYFSVNTEDSVIIDGANIYNPDDLFPPYINIVPPNSWVRSVINNLSIITKSSADYKFGQLGPNEWLWIKSIQYQLDTLKAYFRLYPLEVISDLFGEDFNYFDQLPVLVRNSKTYSHRDVIFHNEYEGNDVVRLKGFGQWYTNFARYTNKDIRNSDFINYWKNWDTKLSYNTSSFIDIRSFLIENDFFDVSNLDYDIVVKTTKGIKDNWIDSINVNILDIPPTIREINNQEDWDFQISTPSPVARPLRFYGVKKFPFSIDDVSNICTIYSYLIKNIDVNNTKIGILGNNTYTLSIGNQIQIVGSTGNDGSYTIDSFTYDIVNNQTIITVIEPLVSSIADGNVELINYRNHGWETGTVVRVFSSSLFPSPLEDGIDYYVIKVSDTKFKLAETLTDAQTNVELDLTVFSEGIYTVGQLNNTFVALDGNATLDIWNHFVLDKSYINYQQSLFILSGIQNVVDFVDGYSAYLTDNGFSFNFDLVERDVDTGRVIDWQLETERFIDWCFKVRNNKFKIKDQFDVSLNITSDVFTYLTYATNWSTGQTVSFTSTGTLPSGIIENLTYYYIKDTDSTFKIASTLRDAKNGNYIDFSSSGTGVLKISLSDRSNYGSLGFEINPFRNNLWIHHSQGTMSEFQQNIRDPKTNPVIYDQNGRAVDIKNLFFFRFDTQSRIKSQYGVTNDIVKKSLFMSDEYNNIHIGGAHIFIDAHEHVLVFNNYTIDDELIYDQFLGLNTPFFIIEFEKQSNFTQRPIVGGYISSGNTLLPNFESSILRLQNAYDVVDSFENDVMTKEARNTLGYTSEKYLNQITTNPKSQFTFWRGVIQNKGSINSVLALENSNKFDQIQIDEYWAYKISEYGSFKDKEYPELKMISNDVLLGTTHYKFIDFAESNSESFDSTLLISQPGYAEIELENASRWYNQPDELSQLENNRGFYFDSIVDRFINIDVDNLDQYPYFIHNFNSSSVKLYFTLFQEGYTVNHSSVTVSNNVDFNIGANYLAGTGCLEVYVNGNKMVLGKDYIESYPSSAFSNTIKFSISLIGASVKILFRKGRMIDGIHFNNKNSSIIEFKLLESNLQVLDSLICYSINFDFKSNTPVRIIDKKAKVVVKQIQSYDPAHNNNYRIIDNLVDFISESNPAKYNISLTPDDTSLDYWGNNEIGKLWINTENLQFIPYYDNKIFTRLEDRIKLWGKMADWYSPIAYEWVESTLTPEEWLTVSLTNVDDNISGIPYSKFKTRTRDFDTFVIQPRESASVDIILSTTPYFNTTINNLTGFIGNSIEVISVDELQTNFTSKNKYIPGQSMLSLTIDGISLPSFITLNEISQTTFSLSFINEASVVATAGQRDFILTNPHTISVGNLFVDIDGIRQIEDTDYIKTSTNTITFLGDDTISISTPGQKIVNLNNNYRTSLSDPLIVKINNVTKTFNIDYVHNPVTPNIVSNQIYFRNKYTVTAITSQSEFISQYTWATSANATTVYKNSILQNQGSDYLEISNNSIAFVNSNSFIAPTFSIISVDATLDKFVISGDQTVYFNIGDEFEVTGSAANNGEWTVKSVNYTGSDTELFVEENITNSSISGVIKLFVVRSNNELVFDLNTFQYPSIKINNIVKVINRDYQLVNLKTIKFNSSLNSSDVVSFFEKDSSILSGDIIDIESSPFFGGELISVNVPPFYLNTEVVDFTFGFTGDESLIANISSPLYTTQVIIDGNITNISIIGSDIQTFSQLLTELNNRVGGNYFILHDNKIILSSPTTGSASSVIIDDTINPVIELRLFNNLINIFAPMTTLSDIGNDTSFVSSNILGINFPTGGEVIINTSGQLPTPFEAGVRYILFNPVDSLTDTTFQLKDLNDNLVEVDTAGNGDHTIASIIFNSWVDEIDQHDDIQLLTQTLPFIPNNTNIQIGDFVYLYLDGQVYQNQINSIVGTELDEIISLLQISNPLSKLHIVKKAHIPTNSDLQFDPDLLDEGNIHTQYRIDYPYSTRSIIDNETLLTRNVNYFWVGNSNRLIGNTSTSQIANNFAVIPDSFFFVDNFLNETSYVNNMFVNLATNSNISLLSGNILVDGITTTPGMRILVKDQLNKVENGIYVSSITSWVRSVDSIDSSVMPYNTKIYVTSGNVNQNTFWINKTVGEFSVNIDQINFDKFNNIINPDRFTDIIIKNIENVIFADDRYVLKLTKDGSLRNELDDKLLLKNKYYEWSLFNVTQETPIDIKLWNKITESIIGHLLDNANELVPSLNRIIYDDTFNTSIRYGLGNGQAFTDGELAKQTILAYLTDENRQFTEVDINTFLAENNFDTEQNSIDFMTAIYSNLSTLHVNEIFMSILLDALSLRVDYPDIMKTSAISIKVVKNLN